MTIGERIKLIREDMGESQRTFGKSIGIGQSTLAMLENGQREINDRHISLICLKHGISEDWLRNGVGEMHSIELDNFTKIAVDIDRNDPKARRAIIDYWNLSDQDKKLFWLFVDRFLKKDGEN